MEEHESEIVISSGMFIVENAYLFYFRINYFLAGVVTILFNNLLVTNCKRQRNKLTNFGVLSKHQGGF